MFLSITLWVETIKAKTKVATKVVAFVFVLLQYFKAICIINTLKGTYIKILRNC